MELDKFIIRAKKKVDDFFKSYMKGYYKQPEYYPLDMSEQEWFEQLSFFENKEIQEEIDCDTCKNTLNDCKYGATKLAGYYDDIICPGYILRK